MAERVPLRGWPIAIATALQESGLLALPHGDRDSIGLFQQRSAWGTYAQRIEPATSSAMFYTGGHGGQPGLLDIPGWEQMTLGEAAQAVQRSAYPDAYAKWEPMADAIVHKISGLSASGCLTPGKMGVPRQAGNVRVHCPVRPVRRSLGGLSHRARLRCSLGTPAMAASVGVVIFSGVDGPYGNLVRILRAGGIATWYGHLTVASSTSGNESPR